MIVLINYLDCMAAWYSSLHNVLDHDQPTPAIRGLKNGIVHAILIPSIGRTRVTGKIIWGIRTWKNTGPLKKPFSYAILSNSPLATISWCSMVQQQPHCDEKPGAAPLRQSLPQFTLLLSIEAFSVSPRHRHRLTLSAPMPNSLIFWVIYVDYCTGVSLCPCLPE